MSDRNQEDMPRASTYDALDDNMTIGGCPVRWEELQAATPTDRKLRRLTVWIADEDFQEHVRFGVDDDDNQAEEMNND